MTSSTPTTHLRLAIAPLALALAFSLIGSAAAPEPAQARACKFSGKPTNQLKKKQARNAMRCLVNRKRSAKNLKLRPKLSEAAQAHTRRMRKQRCFSHQCPGEPTLESRVRSTGYLRGARTYSLGEVIAQNGARAAPRAILRQFMRSSSHRASLMSGTYRHMGVGVSARNGTSLYTIVLARRSG